MKRLKIPSELRRTVYFSRSRFSLRDFFLSLYLSLSLFSFRFGEHCSLPHDERVFVFNFYDFDHSTKELTRPIFSQCHIPSITHLRNFATWNNAGSIAHPHRVFGSRSAMLHTVSVQLPALVASEICKKKGGGEGGHGGKSIK